MKKAPPCFSFGAYTSKGNLGTDSPFELPENNPFYFFFNDGTYKVILSERELIGKWWNSKDQFFIKLKDEIVHQFTYYHDNIAGEFRLELHRSVGIYAMKFIKDNRISSSALDKFR